MRPDYLENARTHAGRPDGSAVLKGTERGRSIIPDMRSPSGKAERPRAMSGFKAGATSGCGYRMGRPGRADCPALPIPLDANRSEAAPQIFRNEWVEKEFDTYGEPHGQDRVITCPQCGEKAREAMCFDVGGHWIFCDNCGVIDCG